MSKNRKGEALEMLTRYHANGDVDDRLVQEEFDQICKSIEIEADQKSAARWTAFLKTKGDRHRLAICILLGFMQEWTGNGTSFIDLLCGFNTNHLTYRCHFILPGSDSLICWDK